MQMEVVYKCLKFCHKKGMINRCYETVDKLTMEPLFFCSKNNDKVKQKVKIPEHCLWNLVSRYKEDNFQRVMCFLFFFFFLICLDIPPQLKLDIKDNCNMCLFKSNLLSAHKGTFK